MQYIENYNHTSIQEQYSVNSITYKKPYKIYKVQDFTNDISNNSSFDQLSIMQIHNFINRKGIIQVKHNINDTDKYEFITQDAKFILQYNKTYGWIEYNNNKTINFKLLDENFCNNITIINQYDINTQNMVCSVNNTHGASLIAVDDCYVKMNDNHTLSIKYSKLKNTKHHPVMMLLSFNKSTNFQSKSNDKYILIKRGEVIAHIPYQSCFSIKIMSRIDSREHIKPLSSYGYLDLKNIE